MSVPSFSVDLLVVTPDQLRKINIKLTKDTKDPKNPSDPTDKGSVDWTMDFGLEERTKTIESFHDVIKLSVKLKQVHHEKAEQTAINGLDLAQSAQALIAADAANLASKGEIPKQGAQAEARKTISVRNSRA